ncbi:MAG TPA: hypothetical protein G4N98_10465 [Thermoflexia bacterium]|nr:hypothetical protein [Thermoflexia bacterium]
MEALPVGLVLATFIILYTLTVRLFIYQELTPLTRKLLIGLVIWEILVTVLFITEETRQILFLGWFLNPGLENNATATFSALQLATVSLVASFNSLHSTKDGWTRAYWLFLAAIFALIGADEFFMLHEPLEATASWHYIYLSIGASLLITSVLIFWFRLREQFFLFFILLSGIAVMGIGGIILDNFVVIEKKCFNLIQPYEICDNIYTSEEFLEMAGVTLVLVGLLNYAEQHSPRATWERLKRNLSWGAITVPVLLLAGFLFLPVAEGKFLAQPVNVTYTDVDLELVGYRLPHLLPLSAHSRRLKINLYWRAASRLTAEYGVSAHLLTHPDIQSVAQNDVLVQYPPHTHWIPGKTMKQTITVDLPAQMDTTRNYWLTVTIWQRPWYDNHRIPIAASDHELVTPDTVILEDITFQP